MRAKFNAELEVDFDLLKEQKLILLNMIRDWGEADDSDQNKDAEKAEGLVHLIDHIQDVAVDKHGFDPNDVYLLETTQ